MLIRREVLAWAGGYRGGIVGAEDYDLWLRIADRYRLANLGEVVVNYRIHPNQVSMRKREQQTLSKLAAKTSAHLRRSGKPDPLNEPIPITPETLAAMGVTQSEQQSELATDYRHWVRTMRLAGEDNIALQAALEFVHSDFPHVERWQIADLYLTIAQIFWKQKQYAQSMGALVHAVVARPLVIGHPLKTLLRRLG